MRGFVNITDLMNKLGVKAGYALVPLHAITCCDIVGEFNTELWLKRFFKNYDTPAKLKNELLGFQIA